MKTQSTAVASVLCVLFTGVAVTEAGKDTIEVTEGGVTFTVDRYDDGRTKPYRVSWNDPGDEFSSTFKFNTDGVVTDLKADGDQYKVKYESNGDLKRVRRTTSRRNLAKEGDDVADVIDDDDDDNSSDNRGHRRLYDCSDCEGAWDTLMDGGVTSVCNLVGYGYPLLESAATAIGIFCFSFGFLSAEEACQGQCDSGCIPPLTIALEWFDDADLDLYVVEPDPGHRVYYGNQFGEFGYIDQDNTVGPEDGPEQYMLYGGSLSTSSGGSSSEDGQGYYWVIVNSYSNDYVPFQLTATTGSGEVTLDVDGAFDPDCEEGEFSKFFRVYFDDEYYVDNDCPSINPEEIMAAGTVNGDKPQKGNRRK